MKSSIAGTIAVFSVVSLLVGCNNAKKTEAEELKLEGDWKLTGGSKASGCFSEMKFFENPESNKDPLYVHETTGDLTKTWYGEYEKAENDIRVIFNEPKAEPFIMAADRNGNELKLSYEWKSANLVCSYQPE
ncbi:hypothetical protein MUG84_04530 [Paenibacillus sp. KQZ6P-2]|uniref:Lipocalin-like domain-containing protein n=1 Tax=Paenibacillus mangrovi TaxID=2931978 RepID=A0A9X1WNV9_9BACL|nr:hypothetical protein [Paenibacillus mangrovi]MCJ8011008.1 hypothetical protein [Paenibacillus mangrovi]